MVYGHRTIGTPLRKDSDTEFEPPWHYRSNVSEIISWNKKATYQIPSSCLVLQNCLLWYEPSQQPSSRINNFLLCLGRQDGVSLASSENEGKRRFSFKNCLDESIEKLGTFGGDEHSTKTDVQDAIGAVLGFHFVEESHGLSVFVGEDLDLGGDTVVPPFAGILRSA